MSAIATLTVVPPVQISGAMLVSSTVPEADYAAWSSATTYALAARVIVVATHKIYESLQAGNLNKDPTSQTAWWVEVSPTNRWKCFDTSNSTQTAPGTTAQYVVNPGESVTALALLNVTDGITLRVRLDSATFGSVYDNTVYTSKILADASWYSFFIGAKKSMTSVVLTDLPAYADATVTVDITGLSTLAFGVLMMGMAKDIGQGVHYGARLGIQDYSRKETNAFGDTVLVKRAYAKRASFNLALDSADVDTVNDYLATLRATPCLWAGSTLYTSTFIFGTYESFETTISYANYSECALNLMGLT
jgi:hypothetical protein